MKIALLLLLVSGSAMALSPSQVRKWDRECGRLEVVVNTAQNTHAIGKTPQQALAILKSHGVVNRHNEQEAKRLINLTYFNPNFSSAPLGSLGPQLYQECMSAHEQQQYAPLQ